MSTPNFTAETDSVFRDILSEVSGVIHRLVEEQEREDPEINSKKEASGGDEDALPEEELHEPSMAHVPGSYWLMRHAYNFMGHDIFMRDKDTRIVIARLLGRGTLSMRLCHESDKEERGKPDPFDAALARAGGPDAVDKLHKHHNFMKGKDMGNISKIVRLMELSKAKHTGQSDRFDRALARALIVEVADSGAQKPNHDFIGLVIELLYEILYGPGVSSNTDRMLILEKLIEEANNKSDSDSRLELDRLLELPYESREAVRQESEPAKRVLDSFIGFLYDLQVSYMQAACGGRGGKREKIEGRVYWALP
jgi:hypothetical protein